MILNDVVVENFGVFRDRQEITLTPQDTTRRITLVGGLNGRGKTTLLDAIQLALYGNRARTSNRGSLSYDTYLSRARFRSAVKGAPFAVGISFTIREEAKVTQYGVRRSWDTSGRAVKETLRITRDGVYDRSLTATWAEHVEELFPLEISSLFFFDGEKIESLADPDQASAVISAAVTSLLGLGVIERLQRDLLVIERKKQDAVIDVAANDQIKLLAEAVEREEATLQAAVEKRASEQTTFDRLEVKLAEIEKMAHQEGGGLFERRTELEQQRDNALHGVISTSAQLREIAAGALPFMMCRSLLESLANDRSATGEVDQALVAQLLEARDADLLAWLEPMLDRKAREEVEAFLESDRSMRSQPFGSGAYRTSLTAVRDARAAMEQALGDVPLALAMLNDRLTEMELGDDFERQLAGVPSEEAIEGILGQRDLVRAELAEARGRLSMLDEEIVSLQRSLEVAVSEHERHRQQTALLAMKGKDAGRILEHASRVRATLEKLKSEVRRRSISNIEKEVLKCYRQLLGKEGLIVGLSLDEETCTPLVTTTQGVQVHIERLSAGERQLLAVAMLWGLARVSGRSLPTIIDTPLGRLDGIHRSLLVDRYFPNAADQVVLLSTDKEIDDDLAGRLEPSIGARFHMKYDEVLQSTSIVRGYFPEEEEHVA